MVTGNCQSLIPREEERASHSSCEEGLPPLWLREEGGSSSPGALPAAVSAGVAVDHGGMEVQSWGPSLHQRVEEGRGAGPCKGLCRNGHVVQSAGNRARAARVAGKHSTTEPLMLLVWLD